MPPTELNARTGEFTPPGMTRWADVLFTSQTLLTIARKRYPVRGRTAGGVPHARTIPSLATHSITTFDCLGRSTHNLLAFAETLRGRGTGLRVLNLGGGGDVDTHTPMGSMVFTVMAALTQMELEIKRKRIIELVAKLRAADKDLGRRRQAFTDSQIRNALRLIEGGEPATQAARDLGMSGAALYRWIPKLPVPTS